MQTTTVNEFVPFPKIARLSRDCIISEKLDGTNAQIWVTPLIEGLPSGVYVDGVVIIAGSRNRWITIEDDNYGFARWVADNAGELAKLGEGHHFGEWWGKGIQRDYGVAEKRFSLFNSDRWTEETKPACCHVVPVLYRGLFDTFRAEREIDSLIVNGSIAAPDFMDPEGIVIYHTAAGHLFKKTCKGDEQGKSQENSPPKVRSPKEPRDKSKGGRRKEQVPYAGADRRMVG